MWLKRTTDIIYMGSRVRTILGRAWGLAIGPSDWSNGATYCTVGNAPVDGWNEPRPGEVWLHEWLHGVCAPSPGRASPCLLRMSRQNGSRRVS